LHAFFSPDQIPKVEQLLLDYGTERHEGGVDRIRLDILTLCGGDITKLAELVKLAKADWRDLIVAAEYDYVDGKYVLKSERGKTPTRLDYLRALVKRLWSRTRFGRWQGF
jgi:hypothetical protein